MSRRPRQAPAGEQGHPAHQAAVPIVLIIRTVTFAVEVPSSSHAVARYYEGGPVGRALLPAALLGRDPAAIVASQWHLQWPDGGPRLLLTVDIR